MSTQTCITACNATTLACIYIHCVAELTKATTSSLIHVAKYIYIYIYIYIQYDSNVSDRVIEYNNYVFE